MMPIAIPAEIEIDASSSVPAMPAPIWGSDPAMTSQEKR
jgi:hypothetical protein